MKTMITFIGYRITIDGQDKKHTKFVVPINSIVRIIERNDGTALFLLSNGVKEPIVRYGTKHPFRLVQNVLRDLIFDLEGI